MPVWTIDPALAKKMKTELETQGFEITQPPYSLFCAKKTGISCTLYTSGKLVVQGKKAQELIEFYLEPQILQSFKEPYHEKIGSDEAGKGDFLGPLCVAAVFVSEKNAAILEKKGIKDSKQLSDKKAQALYPIITELCPFEIMRLWPHKYNELYEKFNNLNHLLAWCHAKVIEKVAEKSGAPEALVDQFTTAPLVQNHLRKTLPQLAVHMRTKAEDDMAVAAASVLARVAFLEGLKKLEQEFGSPLAKGGGSQSTDSARLILSRHGVEALGRIAKLHFKNSSGLKK